MPRSVVIALAFVLLCLGGGAVFYLVGMGGWGEWFPEDPPPVDYAAVQDADQLIALEYARYKRMHESGHRYNLHPRAQHILDNMSTVTTEYQFRVLVVRQLHEVLAAHAEKFKAAHPDIWAAAAAPPPGDGAKLCNDQVAALPYALYPESSVKDIESCRFVMLVKQLHGPEYQSPLNAPLSRREVDTYESEVDEFLAATDVLANRLEAALAKERVYFPTKPVLDPEEPIEFPWPVGWDGMMALRVQVLALRGEHVQARREVFAILKLLERGGITKSLLGALFQVVMVDRFVAKFVVPCACAGALSPTDLEEIVRRGSAIGFDAGVGLAHELCYLILQHLSPTWTENQEIGTAGLPKYLMAEAGKVDIQAWLSYLENNHPVMVTAFEAELPGMLGGEYVLLDEGSFRRCVDVWERVGEPIVGSLNTNLLDMYISQLRWKELTVRARELRERKRLQDWDDPLEPFKDLNGLVARRNQDGIALYLDQDYFSSVGIDISREKPEFLVRFVEYDFKD